MIKLLIGGSPCTYWSIAQSNGKRETKAEGLGWELFKNYLEANKKFKPDFFLYENNKSASQEIKDQIAEELRVNGEGDERFTYINSALVSAQNRQRFYVTNFGDIEQPEDRGVLLKDILENGELIQKTKDEKSPCLQSSYYKCGENPFSSFGCERTRQRIAVDIEELENPKKVGLCPTKDGKILNSQGMRIYSEDGKSVSITANGGGMGGKTGLYAISTDEFNSKKVYDVKNNEVEINGKIYPIKLKDGKYIIRKLTPNECERLQTLPDNYTKAEINGKPVSNSQRYKALGNGWTAEVIIHLLNHALKDVPRVEEIVVLSMYDGIGTGRYCLDKMGFKNVKYYAYEIDKYAIAIAKHNYPDIIECGDAFQVREGDWYLGKGGKS